MRRLSALAAFISLFLLGGCGAAGVEPDADRAGRRFVDAVQRADWPAMDKALSPEVMGDPDHAAKIERMRGQFPADPPWSIKLLKWDRSASWSGRKDQADRYALEYLYGFAGRRLVIDLAVQQTGETRLAGKAIAGPQSSDRVVKLYAVSDLQVRTVSAEGERQNRFWGLAKGPAQWGFLAATLTIPLVMLGAAAAALGARGLAYRWAWALLALVGVGSVWMNWATGLTGQVWGAISVLGSGITRGASPLDPWMLKFASPVGALVVLVRLMVLRGSSRRTGAEPGPPP